MLIACSSCHRQYDVGSLRPGAKVRCFCGELNTIPRERSRPVRMMHCSSCGGALEGKRTTCAYCEAQVALGDRGLGEVCPECFCRMVKGARFCSGCGVEIRPETIVKAITTGSCPRCRAGLAECSATGTRLVECTGCGGVWVDVADFERIAKERERSPKTHDGGANGGGMAVTAGNAADVRYLPCLICGDLMQRRNFGWSGIVVDWCGGHGYWFDTNELEAVLRVVDDRGAGVLDAKAASPSSRSSKAAHGPISGLASGGPFESTWSRRPSSMLDVLVDLFSGFLDI